MKGLANPGFPAEIEIEIAAGLAGGLAEQLGIEVAGAHLEGLNQFCRCAQLNSARLSRVLPLPLACR